jgi:hypothetical protein
VYLLRGGSFVYFLKILRCKGGQVTKTGEVALVRKAGGTGIQFSWRKGFKRLREGAAFPLLCNRKPESWGI